MYTAKIVLTNGYKKDLKTLYAIETPLFTKDKINLPSCLGKITTSCREILSTYIDNQMCTYYTISLIYNREQKKEEDLMNKTLIIESPYLGDIHKKMIFLGIGNYYTAGDHVIFAAPYTPIPVISIITLFLLSSFQTDNFYKELAYGSSFLDALGLWVYRHDFTYLLASDTKCNGIRSYMEKCWDDENFILKKMAINMIKMSGINPEDMPDFYSYPRIRVHVKDIVK